MRLVAASSGGGEAGGRRSEGVNFRLERCWGVLCLVTSAYTAVQFTGNSKC